MRLSYTSLYNKDKPIEYWLELSENMLRFGINNDDGHTLILVDANMDWLVSYLRNKSALLIPQIVQALVCNYSNFPAAQAELLRL